MLDPNNIEQQILESKRIPANELCRANAGLSSPDLSPEDYEIGFEGCLTVEQLTPLSREQSGATRLHLINLTLLFYPKKDPNYL